MAIFHMFAKRDNFKTLFTFSAWHMVSQVNELIKSLAYVTLWKATAMPGGCVKGQMSSAVTKHTSYQIYLILKTK